ncbi:phosphopantetheine-binding protein [Cupriavidus basilensis]|uniref:phosphopantetheine-binding protein n=1 Tax=Cupriavidus basilensis TaxID=68895 RepID=UPI0023E826C8|nr:phosphopantetheine-binding protein [Cupriavidus basilensis]MDF3888456.1 phosphopantetheine-binding protein [Cupriavidus basilensis]
MKALEQEIKELILSSLSLEDLGAADIDTDAPLFIEGLGLDSIDALELGLALQKRYGVTMNGDKEEMRARFASVAALAAFVASHRNSEASA